MKEGGGREINHPNGGERGGGDGGIGVGCSTRTEGGRQYGSKSL